MRLSAGRGEYKKTKLKIEESKLARMQKRVDLQMKVRQYHNHLITLREKA
jgi:hypothetical protein